jgi:glycosidase
MSFVEDALARPRPESIRAVELPSEGNYFPSPADWRDEVIYFLLPDRFSDGGEGQRPLLDRRDLARARQRPGGQPWRWDHWVQSGATRWQGGTLRGALSKLDYLAALGVTTLWLGPVFKQRLRGNTYHGYAIQDFLDVDPRLGTRRDLVELVRAAHGRGLRVLLDVVFNHSGTNWLYAHDAPGGAWHPRYRGWPHRYPFGAWLDPDDRPIAAVTGPGDGVWPRELQHPDCYTRAGRGSLDDNAVDDPRAEHKRTDFHMLRDFDHDHPGTLDDLVRCYQYWIALTDCDGFRIDTLKHVSMEAGARFCAAVKEYAARLGKHHFFLVGEIGGGDAPQARYLDVLGDRLSAVLDIGPMRGALTQVAKGLQASLAYFGRFGREGMAGYRVHGNRHVSVVNDHDHIFGDKVRFGVDAASEHQVAAAVALQYFTLGIPCVYAGMEQNLGGPEPPHRRFLSGRWRWGHSDVYLREALFGPAHPRGPDAASLTGLDLALPGFGPYGTSGHHCFDPGHPAYLRIAELGRVRRRHAVLRTGRQAPCELSLGGGPFRVDHGGGQLIAWSRTLDSALAVCVMNGHGRQPRSGDVAVEGALCPPGSSLTVMVNTAAASGTYRGTHAPGEQLVVKQRPGGPAFVSIRDLPPSEVLILANAAVSCPARSAD